MKRVKILGIIPARYASTRFPGKPLALIAGKPLIQRVAEQCRQAASLSEVIVATDDARIAKIAKNFCRVEMTRADHPSGSDRIAEVAARCACDAVVNIQGDEPLMDPTVIDAVAGALAQNEMSTAATPVKNISELDNPNVVKVVVNAAGRALYFSRRTIPYLREAASRPVPEQLAAFPFLKHLGIYGYRRETLLRLVKFPVSPLEHAEKLEQLRALENGIQIAVVNVDYDSVGVDVPEDVALVERIISCDSLDLIKALSTDEGKPRITHDEVKKRYDMDDKNLCKVVQDIPPGAAKCRWTLRADNHGHYHGRTSLSKSPLYLELHWRLTADDSVRRVGVFRLDLIGLLRDGYIRREPTDSNCSDVRLRIVRADNGCFYVQTNQHGPRLLLA